MFSSTLVADDSALIAKYGIPMPPAANALLETAGPGSPRPQTSLTSRDSLLLDVNDDIGMRLLLSNASIDALHYRILSLEEVERLKSEKTLLDSRIEAHTRKLALESKVKDASQNLIRLHATRNKRMSKQAEEQLEHATRKVEDLATDLWRLQQRQSIINQQLLEHTAGILARNANDNDMLRRSQYSQDFDETHLYRDSSMSYRDSISSNTSHSMVAPKSHGNNHRSEHSDVEVSAAAAAMKAEAKLRETNRQLFQFLRSNTDRNVVELESNVDEHSEAHNLDLQLLSLEQTLLVLQECLLEQKEQCLSAQHSREVLIARLHTEIVGERARSDPAQSIEEAIIQKAQELKAIQRDSDEHQARSADIERQHAISLQTIQADYEKELEAAHVEVDQLRESILTREEQLQSHEQSLHQKEDKLRDLQAELRKVQGESNDRSTRESSLRQEVETQAALVLHLEKTLSALQDRSALDERASMAQVAELQSNVTELNNTLQGLNAEILVLKSEYDACKIELQVCESGKAIDRQNNDAQMADLSQKHVIEIRSITAQHNDLIVQKETQLSDLRRSLNEAIHLSETASLQLTTENSGLKQQALAFASEKAVNQSSPSETALEGKCAHLEAEMRSMLPEFEALTRSALSYEAERAKSETRIDELLERVIVLESQLADQKVTTLGYSSAAGGATRTEPGAGSPTTTPAEPPTTASLRKEFRRLVQDMRSEHAKQTREDFTEIRRLERQLAAAQLKE